MSGRKGLKSIHFASTVWFIACVCYILVSALRQAGFNWWIIFSLSGHSVLLIFLLISLYLFAILRSVRRVQKIEVEHPLTSTGYYIAFYTITPFLGSFAGCLGTIGANTVSQFLLGIAMGTFGATFLAWVIVDPAIGLLEMLLPASRRHRAERLAQAEAERERKRKNRERLLADVSAKEESDRCHWEKVLKPQAEKLAELLVADETGSEQIELEAVAIGANAWRIGGLSCMRQLRDMALAITRERNLDMAVVDYISVWWDGVGSWRNLSLPLG